METTKHQKKKKKTSVLTAVQTVVVLVLFCANLFFFGFPFLQGRRVAFAQLNTPCGVSQTDESEGEPKDDLCLFFPGTPQRLAGAF
jgi:hypothetical protein